MIFPILVILLGKKREQSRRTVPFSCSIEALFSVLLETSAPAFLNNDQLLLSPHNPAGMPGENNTDIVRVSAKLLCSSHKLGALLITFLRKSFFQILQSRHFQNVIRVRGPRFIVFNNCVIAHAYHLLASIQSSPFLPEFSLHLKKLKNSRMTVVFKTIISMLTSFLHNLTFSDQPALRSLCQPGLPYPVVAHNTLRISKALPISPASNKKATGFLKRRWLLKIAEKFSA